MVALHSTAVLDDLFPDLDEIMYHIEEEYELPPQVRVFNPTECAELGLVPPRAIARRYRISVSRLLGALFNPTFPVHAGEAATIPGGWSITAQDLPEGTGARIRANRLKKRLYVGDEVIAWVRRHRPEWELNADQLLHTAVDLEARGFQGLAEYHLELGIEKQNS